MFDVNQTFYTKDDVIGEFEPLELHDKDFEKVEEGVDVEINKTTISQSVTPVNVFMQDICMRNCLKKSRKILLGSSWPSLREHGTA